jgi:3-phosphoshikimate 1-carboxyvinyltransferase
MKNMSHTFEQGPDQQARSPWSRYTDKQEVRISPPKVSVDNTISIPGSKSLTNRALIIAALAKGTSRLEGILRSDDSYWCVNSLIQLGIHIEIVGETAIIQGSGGDWPIRDTELYIGASGTIARFLPGALAVGNGVWKIRGSRRLSERPLAPLLDSLIGMGAEIHYEEAKGYLPITIHANGLRGGEIAISGSISSQFISGLLLAAPYTQDPLVIRMDGEVVQHDYVEMTLHMMRAFGVFPIAEGNGHTIVVPSGKYKAQTISLEPDVSTCCYFWAIAALSNGRVRINGINSNSQQPDIEMLDALQLMGCLVHRGEDFIEVQGTNQLKGGFTLSMRRWSDQLLTLAALAPFADGPITLTDAAHIRHHECDRIHAMYSELHKLGIQVEEHPDGLTVHPGSPKPVLLDSHDDHRMAMALSLIGVRIPGIRISDPGCVSKTCPDFFERLAGLGVEVSF